MAFLEVSGPDATAFLHRLSTQDILNAPRGIKFGNCFLDQKGRLIDVVIQEKLDENRWLIVTAHSSVEKLKVHLEKYWFSEKLNIIEGVPAVALAKTDGFERIKRLLPAAPNEINESFNPLELGLKDLIAWDKGCYIGQEVISRLDTYDKVSRQLMSVACKEEDFDGLKKSPEITTILDKYVKDQPVAMGVFKKAALTGGLFMTTSNGTPVWVVSSAR